MKKNFFKLIIFLGLYFGVYTQLFCESRIYVNDQIWTETTKTKNEKLKSLLISLEAGETPSWLESYAPLIWWHSDEKYKTTDPNELLNNTELWYREINAYLPFYDRELINLGPIRNLDLKTFKYNGYSPLDEVTRILEHGSIKKGLAGFELRYDADQIMKNPAPVFWRISKNPLFQKIQNENPNEILLPIEFWYHYNYNRTGVYFANHDGDWESSLILIQIKNQNEILQITPYMVSFSAHGGSSWFCNNDLNHHDTHVEIFSAVGTHASYGREGYHWRFIYPDRTEKGTAWETWKLIKPLVKENFYGYSGSWGRSSYVHFQNAPISPGPRFKYLPAELNTAKAVEKFQQASVNCKI